ncbi:PREDICTED: fibrillin-1-like isoform X2 [Wasmannia auropunctata]|uniref:fibrillin-1-like isoform X2 n=1 Tax=Wasmannia auropunctata TaxID=64793 RepID=UPI0005EDE8C3|nr:PREDICTED: fibrillin-1-like isoform X2 [Wasmannia auropunctata]
MARYIDFAAPFILLLLMVHLEQLVLHKRALVVEGRMEAQFEKCCGLGTSWAKEGLRCEKFTGPVTGVPVVEQGLCLEAVDICCVRAYHELQCEKGKADAREGLACVTSATSQRSPKTPGRGDYHRDCCEGCKLGILAGSMGQGCSFKSFSFGIPWDPAFMECCREASPSSTTDLTSELTSETSTETDLDFSSSSSPTSSYSPSPSLSSSSSSPSLSSSPSSSPLSSSSSFSTSPSSFSSSSSSPTSPLSTSSDDPSSTSSDSTPYSIPTPELDDICQLMKGKLCSDICVPTQGSYRCECRDGFTLLQDGKTCKQIDRCRPTHPCEHRCTDNGVAVVCSCNPGYDLASDGRSCIARSPRNKKKPDKAEDNELSPLCPLGYRYNATIQVCDDVDECLERNVCPDGGCQNTIGSYICIRERSAKNAPYEACPPGYEWQPLTGECVGEKKSARLSHKVIRAPSIDKFDKSKLLLLAYFSDIDECAVLSAACAADKPFCVNTQGSYECLEMTGVKSCPAGFKFDKTLQLCKDVDECAEAIHSCLADVEQCRNTEGAYECDMKCGKGFTYSISLGVCVDVDECIESRNPCPDPSTICVNTEGAYECTKISASPFPRLPIDKDPSDRQKNMQSGSRMTCSAGYKLSNDSGMTRCIDVDECNEKLHSCEPDERCVNEIGSYRCVPIENTTGMSITEETNVNQRDDRFSRGNKLEGTSVSSVMNEIEDCNVGYVFDGKSGRCIDVDECANGKATCDTGERCVNTEGGYRCSPICPPGFRLRNTSRYTSGAKERCEDINECLLGLHTCNSSTQYCINTNGSYVCGTRTTTSTTETTTSDIARRPFIGSRYNRGTDRYWSTEPCGLGYKRDADTGYCVDIDECAVGPGCRDHEKCRNTPGGYDCSPLCSTGWYFSTTTKGCQDVDECLLGRHDCPQSTHRCVNTNGSFVCELILPCSRGYRRAFNGTCLDIDECSEGLHNCRLDLHQYCANKEGGFECLTRLPSCPSGYQYSLGTRRCEDIDECLIGQYSCDAKFSERCVNLPGTYRCERPPPPPPRQRQRPACPSGYRYRPDFRMCTVAFNIAFIRDINRKLKCQDIDECEERLDNCGGDKRCYNQPGGYSCALPPVPMTRKPSTTPIPAPMNEKCIRGTRFVRNRGCVDVNECRELEDACSSNEDCVNTIGSYMCTCKTGFRRDNLTQACVDINECQLQENDCLATQRCDNTIGSYTCTRFLPCGTGYTLNAATEICEDDDECVLGTHDCGPGYQCRNTLGSYRCDRIPRIPAPSSRTSPMTTTTMRIATFTTTTTPATSLTPAGQTWPNCPRGFESGSSGKCVDIDECQRTPNPCFRSMQKCINTLGSYRCASVVICLPGYTVDATGQHCIDIDECREGTHECGKGQTCENRQGGYHCICPPGHTVGPNNDCVDIDECSIYGSGICGLNSRCENTVGSYKCLCGDGFENTGGTAGACQDIDECQQTPGLCQHICLNVWGNYRCGCESGFRLNADNRTCIDIDECTEFKDNHLCIGICENTPGSYACKCPEGYRLGIDGRTCQDIDECEAGQVCRDAEEMCQNTRGGFRCNRINCPSGYHRDHIRKNRCVRSSRFCRKGDLACLRSPSHYSYNYITFVSMLPIPSTGQLELFTMRGSHQPDSTIQFSMALMDVRAPPDVARATESCFALRRPASSQAVLVMTRPIAGPQEIELDLSMEIYHDAVFIGSAIAKIFIFVSQYEF